MPKTLINFYVMPNNCCFHFPDAFCEVQKSNKINSGRGPTRELTALPDSLVGGDGG